MGILKDILSNKKQNDSLYGKLEDKVDIYSNTSSIRIAPDLVMMNDGVNICAVCCASCWDTPLPMQYGDRAVYVGKRSRTGHTSVVEHSNVVFYMHIPEEYYEDFIEFMAFKHYLHTCVKRSKIDKSMHMIIGGSWRAFSDLYLFANNIYGNAIMRAITNGVYYYIPSCGMLDIVDKGILNIEDFNDLDKVDTSYYTDVEHSKVRLDDNINIVNVDSIKALVEKISTSCGEPELFTLRDLLRFVTVTIEFNGMSRIITQQLTRHRNAITQESQRYVDYSGAPFNSPAKFKPERYDEKKLYEFNFGGQKFKMNMQSIGNAINGIYPQLRDKAKNGDAALIPEDARGFLANNTQCGKIYMTFTYYSLIKFLQLREDKHAQAEIRGFATRIGEWFRKNVMTGSFDEENYDIKDLYDALLPNMIDDYSVFSKPIVTVTDEGDGEISQYTEDMTDEEFERLAINSIEVQDSSNTEEK